MNVYIHGIGHQPAAQCAADFLKDGCRVFAAEEDWVLQAQGLTVLKGDTAAAFSEREPVLEPVLDILVVCASVHMQEDTAIDIGAGRSYDDLSAAVSGAVFPCLQIGETLIPLMENSPVKRIAFLSETASSINSMEQTGDFARHMTQAALHMMQRIWFNRLRPKGYTFRCYAETIVPFGGGMSAKDYILQDFSFDANEPFIHSEENRLVMRDSLLREIPW